MGFKEPSHFFKFQKFTHSYPLCRYDPTIGECRLSSTGERITGYSHPSIATVIELGFLCNNAQITHGTVVGQPTEGALMVLALKVQLPVERINDSCKRLKEIPFSSETKWMAIQLERAGGGTEVIVKGALDKVVQMCVGYMDGHGQAQPLGRWM